MNWFSFFWNGDRLPDPVPLPPPLPPRSISVNSSIDTGENMAQVTFMKTSTLRPPMVVVKKRIIR